MVDQEETGFFVDMAIPKRDHSARTWTAKGHVPTLAEARQVALDELAAAEALLAERDAELASAWLTMKQAVKARDKAYNARQEARLDVKKRQEHLAWVCSTDAPKEPPHG